MKKLLCLCTLLILTSNTTWPAATCNTTNSQAPTNEDEELCSICLDTYTPEYCTLEQHGPKVPISCKHIFHKNCINEWFATQESEKTCPLCKARVVTDTEALFTALNNNNQTQALLLLATIDNINLKNRSGYTPLMVAVEKNMLAVIEALLTAGADVNIPSTHERKTALMDAAVLADPTITQLLLAAHANPNLQHGYTEKTALMLAVTSHRLATTQALLAAGAQINLQDGDGYTALMVAAKYAYTDILNFLLTKNANFNVQNAVGDTALMIATKENYPDIAQTLIDRGAKLNIQNRNGLTALMIATNENNLVMVQTLLAAHADPNIKNRQGHTALALALRGKKSHPIIELLREHTDLENLSWLDRLKNILN